MTTLVITALVASGCGSLLGGKAYQDRIGDCISSGRLNEDQRKSFMPPAQNFPLHVIADPAFGDQANDIAQAIQQWNSFGERNMGQTLFKLETGTAPAAIQNGNPRNCADSGLSDDSFYMVRQHSSATWSALGFNEQTPGATIRCYSGDSLSQQVVMVRPDLVRSTQFSSVVVHELGHSLGLDHSCATDNPTSDFRACATLDSQHPYRMAVMYPTLSVWSGLSNGPEIKANLADNDVVRAECLLGQ